MQLSYCNGLSNKNKVRGKKNDESSRYHMNGSTRNSSNAGGGGGASSYTFSTKSLPDELNEYPTLGNGHIGFTIFGDTVYMNGLYNGVKGLSHRARIPNYGNIRFDAIKTKPNESSGGIGDGGGRNADKMPMVQLNVTYSLNTKSGLFQIKMLSENFKIIHLIYPHRFYNRAIINQIYIYRSNNNNNSSSNYDDGDITIQVNQNAGNTTSEDITFNHKKIIRINNQNVTSMCGYTNEVEDPEYQAKTKHVCVLWNHVPEEITLKKGIQVMSYGFVMTVDGVLSVAKQEMMDVLKLKDKKLLKSHKNEWNNFWTSFKIDVKGNTNLARTIYASIFYLICSLPSNRSNLPPNKYFGLSPTGLGRGKLIDYEGHSFWDTEIFMLPSILLMNPRWSEELLHYRYTKLHAAEQHANLTGFKGARFPWESAFTGVEVTQPCCPLVAENQLHISADISFALRNHFAATNDLEWLRMEGCPMAREIAKFWSSRIVFNKSIGFYEINNVMGPDEDHANISNNVYTNVIAAYALYFGEFALCMCNKTKIVNETTQWNEMAQHIKLLYDSILDYHPEYDGFDCNTENLTIKQADTILIGYPLLYQMDEHTRKNDLNMYEALMRSSGPAMTWSMHCINQLDLNQPYEADILFLKSYEKYLRGPFYVWRETVDGGATNFITGAGGFLQTILNGYAGIRMYIDRMEIQSPRMPPQTDKLSITGIKYLGSIFKLKIKVNVTKLICTSLNAKIPLTIGINNDWKMKLIIEKMTYKINGTKFIIKRSDNIFGKCELPKDIIGIQKN